MGDADAEQLPAAIPYLSDNVSAAAKAQQDPHWPWSRTLWMHPGHATRASKASFSTRFAPPLCTAGRTSQLARPGPSAQRPTPARPTPTVPDSPGPAGVDANTGSARRRPATALAARDRNPSRDRPIFARRLACGRRCQKLAERPARPLSAGPPCRCGWRLRTMGSVCGRPCAASGLGRRRATPTSPSRSAPSHLSRAMPQHHDES